MMRKFLFLLMVFGLGQCVVNGQVHPRESINFDGSIEDFILNEDFLYAVGDEGKLYCINPESKKIIKSLALPKIKDFTGSLINPKIYGIAVDARSGVIILASQGQRGYGNIYLIKDWNPEILIKDVEYKWMISELMVPEPGLLVVALLSNEIILYNYIEREIIYQTQAGFSTLTDISLNDEKTQLAIADEGGVISLFDIEKGEVIKRFDSENVDKINKVSYQGKILAGAGQDRRLSIYNTISGSGWHIESDFLIFSLGMDPGGQIVVYNADESNDLNVFDLQTRKSIARLVGHKGIVTKVYFTSSVLITSGEDGKLCWWELNN